MALHQRCDVAVIGGGPAGAAAAITLRQVLPDLQVVLCEASTYSSWRVGESLAPAGAQLLHGLGCWPQFSAEKFLQSYGTTAVWGSDCPYSNEFLFSGGGNGWHLDRARFDALLAQCAEHAGVEVRRGTRFVHGARQPEGNWRLALETGGETDLIDTGFVIDATGRAAVFAARQGAKRVLSDNLAGVFVTYRFPTSAAPRNTDTLVEAQEDGWWYSALLPQNRMAVAWMSDADLLRGQGLRDPGNWLRHLNEAPLTRAALAEGQAEFPARLCIARSQLLAPACGPGWIAAGDAASTFDPLSSAGMVKALRGGKLAAFAVLDDLRGLTSGAERYQEIVAREYREYLSTRAWFYNQEQRWPHSRFWRRRHAEPSHSE